MIAKVSEQGLLIPKELLAGVDQVEIRQENDTLRIIPLSIGDSILNLGADSIDDEVTDASSNHDRYLYKA
jgi:virulence-associated protein VagC